MDSRLMAARLRATHLFPYFSSALFSLIPIETNDVIAMSVDKRWRMRYNPGIFDQWTVPEIACAMVHEAMHLLRDHPERASIALPHEFILWNLGADCEINDDLTDIGLPEGCVYPSTFGFKDGLMAEEYFNLLKQNKEFMESFDKMMSSRGDAGEGQTINGETIKVKINVGAGQCGGCATGEGDEETIPGTDGSPTTGITANEVRIIKETVAKDIISCKGRGNIPSGLVRWAEEQLKSTIPWRTLLQGCVRGMIGNVAGMVNYHYERPSRRQSVFGRIIMPSLRAPQPITAFLVDTSGSMSAKELGLAVAEVDGVLRSLGTDVTVISNDAEVGAVKKVRSKHQIELVGGGGTALGPGILKASELKPTPNFLVIVSDCDADWGDFIPRFPVILVKIGDGNHPIPEWIKRVIQVENN